MKGGRAALLALALGAASGWLLPGSDQEWVAPPEEAARPNPVRTSPEAVKRGRSLYRQHCATCHGERGKGDGPYSRLHARRAKPPKDLTLPEAQARLTDGEIFWKLSTGLRQANRIFMPSFGEDIGSENDRWKVVLYVRELGAGHE